MRLWAIVALIGILSAIASAETGEWTYKVAKDNYYNKSKPEQNNATRAADRAGNGTNKGWYGDWSAKDKEEIKKKIESLGADETYTLTFRTATNAAADEMHGKADFKPSVAAFSSAEDWVEAEANFTEAAKGKPWLEPKEKAAVDFNKLPRIANSTPVVGNWDKASTDTVFMWNSAVLDKPVVDALTSDANCRGLVMFGAQEKMYNDYNFSKKKWKGKATPELVLKIEKKAGAPAPAADPAK